ncbi:V-type ATP synthase subunit E [Carnobacterium mobile]|uniref:V-type ATP synthase subunit E n=1 Tax=Carnobacterium mobile TaxID=2750 RepID=UPI001866C69D|nr:ATPase [Carnobacterium mobile]
MSDLKLITERMIEKKKAEVQQTIRQAETEAKEKLASAEKELASEEAEQKRAIDRRLANDFEKNKDSLENYKRNQLLAEKQVALKEVFKQALFTMEEWNETEFQNFLLAVLQQFKETKNLELVLGEKSVEKVSQEGITVTLATETINKKAGFILKDNGIEYNYLFEDLIAELKNQIIPSVSENLF